MNVLITGHRGFVGRHFWERFSFMEKCGSDVVGGHDCRRFFQYDDRQFDLVIHLAALVGGRATIEGSPLAVADNLSIDAALFKWAMRTKPKRLVYFSSSAAYPTELQTQPYKLKEDDIDLDAIKTPDQTYGWVKLTGEMLARHIEAEGVRTYVMRPFSGYGEDQDPAYPFRAFVDRAKAKADPFTIWGDGEQVRDFIHIEDIVDATLAAIDNDISGPVNLGSGHGVSFNELAEMVTNQAGYCPDFHRELSAPVGVKYRVANCEKMRGFYLPKISLSEGIQLALTSDDSLAA